MMWITREIKTLLTRRAAQRPVIVLTGPRQMGKTNLVQRLFPQHEFVSLDLPSEAEQAEHDPREFLARHRPPLAPNGFVTRSHTFWNVTVGCVGFFDHEWHE